MNTDNKYLRLHPDDIRSIVNQIVFHLKENCLNDTIQSDDELLTIHQAAAELKITYQTIYKWIRNNKISAVVVGNRAVRIKRSEIEQLKQVTFCPVANISSGRAHTLNSTGKRRGDRSWK